MSITPASLLESRLELLPLLPAVVREIASLRPEADDYLDQLLILVERDPGLALRMLRCANSAYEAPSAPILSLHQAVRRLGTQQCVHWVHTLAAAKVCTISHAHGKVWRHSFQTALFARMFVREQPSLRGKGEQAYACGLLHDLGRLLLLEAVPADLALVDGAHWSSTKGLLGAERRILGYDHAFLGWHACRQWALPDSIAEIVRRHHEDLPADGNDSLDMLRIVRWAQALSMTLLLEPELVASSANALAARLAESCDDSGPLAWPAEAARWQPRVAELHAASGVVGRQLGLL
jgi:putative nucleotidyltransferase with HDIG domain